MLFAATVVTVHIFAMGVHPMKTDLVQEEPLSSFNYALRECSIA